MEQSITLQALVQVGAVFVALVGFYKAIMEVIKMITSRHDREKKWDETVEDLEKGRQEIIKRYDNRLSEMEQKIDDNHNDTETNIQDLKNGMIILTQCTAAILDGLKQLECNGKVTEAKEKLDKYLMDRAYD